MRGTLGIALLLMTSAPLAAGVPVLPAVQAYLQRHPAVFSVCVPGSPVAYGAACFNVPEDAAEASVEVRDVSLVHTVTAYYRFLRDGVPLSHGGFCNTATLAVPEGADMLWVDPQDLAYLGSFFWPCGGSDAGSVLVAFS